MNSIIKNSRELSLTPLRHDALAIAEAGYAAIDVGAALERKLRIEDDELRVGDAAYLLAGRRIFFIGIGKCAVAASEAVEKLLGDRLTAGIALDVSDASTEGRPPLRKIETFVGTHPLPSEANERASQHIVELLSGCREDDLVLMLISGGGSTLLCLPPEATTYEDEGSLFTELTAQGASIQELNTVRKHLSLVRGGGLAKAAYPAEVLSLIVSDVPGNDIEYISSGPTVQDTSTVEDARAVLAAYGIQSNILQALMETPKEPTYFERVTNVLFLTNQDALVAMKAVAEQRGYATTIVTDHFSGEASEVAHRIVEQLHDAAPKTALLYAGESTVTFEHAAGKEASAHSALTEGKPPIRGGRNQEMALAVLRDVRDDELFLPFDSDGQDNTNHAGAIADATTLAHADAHGVSIEESLTAHRSYDFFATTGDALQTGYTGSNVSDIIIAIKN
ncbi:MAG: glycerate kinase type-2 family protein [Minisyncoccota bacterium]